MPRGTPTTHSGRGGPSRDRARGLGPARPNATSPPEHAREDFLFLSGGCLLLVDEEDRPRGPWDLVHPPAGVSHAFVGAGGGPCILVMAGARKDEPGYRYPV